MLAYFRIAVRALQLDKTQQLLTLRFTPWVPVATGAWPPGPVLTCEPLAAVPGYWGY